MSFMIFTAQESGKVVKAYIETGEILAVTSIDTDKTIQIQFKERPFNDTLFYKFTSQDLYNAAKIQISAALE